MPAPPEAKLIPLRKASSFGDNDKYGGGDGMPSFSAEKFHKKLAAALNAKSRAFAESIRVDDSRSGPDRDGEIECQRSVRSRGITRIK